jgi:BirA family biotin operon repressor/biotin-[acetyl-CoA-carboxylase] ligase
VRAAAEQNAPEGTVIIARAQTAGRGRQGRAFFSPPGTGLYLSMLLRPQETAEELTALTPMAAVAAAEAVTRCSGREVQIKWVNDLLLGGKKICGILAESKFSGSSGIPDYAVIGIGINLLEPAGGFPPELRETADAVFPADADAFAAFTDCAAALILALREEYTQLSQRHYLRGYRQRLCVLGRPLTVVENGAERPATALAVDDDLRLLVRYDDGTEQWRSTGEIRLRLNQSK